MIFTHWKGDALLSHAFPEGQFLVEPLIPRGGAAVLHGPRAVGKSQLALTLALNVAQGERFLGLYECAQSRVLFVEVDTAPQIMQQRLRACSCPRGLSLSFLTGDPFDITAVARTPSADPAWREARATDPDLVIVDSLRKSHREDENESNTPSLVYKAWHQLFPEATFLFVHHDRKIQLHGGDLQDENFRGSSAWLDDVDTGLHMFRQRGRLTLSFSKLRTAEEQPALGLKLNPTTLLIELGEATPKQKLFAHMESAPEGWTKRRGVDWLLAAKLCSRATAWRIVTDLRLPETNSGSVSVS